MLSHEEGGSIPQINTFFNFLPSGISPHKGGICLLGSVEEKEDVHAEAHEEGEALVAEILSERVDVSLENNFVGPFLRSSKYHPDSSLVEGTFIRIIYLPKDWSIPLMPFFINLRQRSHIMTLTSPTP